MINKIAESHFNALRAASHPDVQPEGNEKAPTATHDALNMFLSTPSFSGKQIAIESLLRQITQGTAPGKISTLG
ncbi:MAG: hypothetical protein C4516_00250 [Oxalobacter sp.]|nr:MAG: hypothetical protein C4516_00250 [Oxalobacter sp.]